MQQSHLSEIIKGKRNITEQLAEKLEEALKIPAEHWRQLQAKYDYKLKAANLKAVEEREADALLAEYNRVYDLKTIFKNVGIAMKSASEKLKFCLEVLCFGTPAVQMRQLKGCYHRSEKTGLDPRMIATWSVLAKYEAGRKMEPTERFDRDKMDNLAIELRIIFNENNNTINRVERTLANYGIRFCIVIITTNKTSMIINSLPPLLTTFRSLWNPTLVKNASMKTSSKVLSNDTSISNQPYNVRVNNEKISPPLTGDGTQNFWRKPT
jgi:HTH-type transcriptional regulator/antitoxin HigA